MFKSLKRAAAGIVIFAAIVPGIAMAQTAKRNQCEFYGKSPSTGKDHFIGIASGEAVALAGQKQVYNTMAFKTSKVPPTKVTSVKVRNGCTAGVTSQIGTGASEYTKDSAVNTRASTGVFCICK